MNEDERGITPADVTAITVSRRGGEVITWQVIIEQGNGDVIKMLELTEMERIQLALMLGDQPGRVAVDSCSFLDPFRPAAPGAPARPDPPPYRPVKELIGYIEKSRKPYPRRGRQPGLTPGPPDHDG